MSPSLKECEAAALLLPEAERATLTAHLTQREAATRPGLTTGSGVSYQVRKLRSQMEHNDEVRRLMAKATKALEAVSEIDETSLFVAFRADPSQPS